MTNTVLLHLYEILRTNKFIETESRLAVTMLGGGKNGQLLYNG